jgi:hypothetical protein
VASASSLYSRTHNAADMFHDFRLRTLAPFSPCRLHAGSWLRGDLFGGTKHNEPWVWVDRTWTLGVPSNMQAITGSESFTLPLDMTRAITPQIREAESRVAKPATGRGFGWCQLQRPDGRSGGGA